MLDFHLPALSDPVAYTDQDLDHSSGNDYNTDRFPYPHTAPENGMG